MMQTTLRQGIGLVPVPAGNTMHLIVFITAAAPEFEPWSTHHAPEAAEIGMYPRCGLKTNTTTQQLGR